MTASTSNLAGPNVAVSEPDKSARAGIFLGALALGSSFQPNLLTRSTRDQAIVSGLSAAIGYGAATVGNSVFSSLVDRVPGESELVGELALSVGGAAVVKALPAHEHESDRRAGTRLAALAVSTLGVASLASRLNRRLTSESTPGKRFAATVALAAAGAGTTYLALRSEHATVGSQSEDGTLFEDAAREVRPGVAVAVSVAVTGLLVGLAHGESYVSSQSSALAARILGGRPEDHRTLGRVTTLASSFVIGRYAMSKIWSTMNKVGEQLEAAHKIAPTIPEVTGSPDSHVPWSLQSREGRRWLSMVLRPDEIADVIQEPAKQPIRVYASLESESTDEARAALLLRELERTGAFDRSVLALFSPTGSGYVNYVASETLEYLTRGDCASATIEYSVLPSAMSLTLVPLGIRQTRLVVDGIVERLLATPIDQRPKFVLFGESLGSQVSQGMFNDQGVDGPKSVGLDAAVWIGTPSASTWRKQLWGTRTIANAPGVGPDTAYLPRNVRDWHELEPSEKHRIDFLLLQNGDDPIPKFGSQLSWRQPDWLGPDSHRPIGTPKGTRWVPMVTFLQTFIDMLNALLPTPGIFAEGGHDYRVEVPEALRTVWRLSISDEAMARVQQALRRRERQWETTRRWETAEANADPKKRAEAELKTEKTVAGWLGEARDAQASPEQIQSIIDEKPLAD
ncbi:MAG: alpha/beta-hydrolase family protein [Candidatus Nanopelagicales bacterium]